jgi:uncharacterized damage-inducible protein DinB
VTEVLAHLRRQFEYDDWANREVVAALKLAGAAPAAALAALAHVVGAEWLWLTRIRQADPPLPVWPDLTLDECGTQLEELAGGWNWLFSDLRRSGLGGEVSYVNSKGESWTSSVQDILQHVLLHSAYHRGQIASAMRSGGFAPPYTDYIHCVREDLI